MFPLPLAYRPNLATIIDGWPTGTWWLSGSIDSANCLAAYQPKGAASLAASYSNVANPGTNDAAPGDAPSFNAATGWTFNGSSNYLLVGSGAIKADVPLSMICLFNADNVTATAYLLSICRSADRVDFFGLSEAGSVGGDPVRATTVANNAYSHAVTSTGFTAGTFYTGAAVFDAVDDRRAFIDGGSKGTEGTSSTPAGLDVTYIGCNNVTAGPANFFAGKIAACAFYNTNLSDAQVLAVSNAMAAL